jgi:hypothetical protein
MSPRRGGVVIPLVALVASFMVVLVLGALFATGSSEGSPPPPTTGGGGTAAVQVTVNDLTGDKEVWDAFPGVRLTVTPAAKESGTAGSVSPPSAEVVNVCVTPPAGWKAFSSSEEWLPQKGQNSFCHQFSRITGKVPKFVLRLERQR